VEALLISSHQESWSLQKLGSEVYNFVLNSMLPSPSLTIMSRIAPTLAMGELEQVQEGSQK